MDHPESKEPTTGSGAASRTPRDSLWGAATSWSLIQRAKGTGGDTARNEAWKTLIGRYEHPITVGLRRRLPPHLVREGASSFFSYLYEKSLIDRADPQRGRFRCYIQGIMRRWAMHYTRAETSKKAPPLEDVPIPAAEGEARLEAQEDADWASHLLQRAVDALQSERAADVTLLARAYGLTPERSWSREALATELGITVNALNVRLYHARQRLRTAIDAEIHHICTNEVAWNDEKRTLLLRLRHAHPRLIVDLEEREGP